MFTTELHYGLQLLITDPHHELHLVTAELYYIPYLFIPDLYQADRTMAGIYL